MRDSVAQIIDTSSKLKIGFGVHYFTPDADIKLTRGDRKTVTHDLSGSLGLSGQLIYKLKGKKYLAFITELNSFKYVSTESFFFNNTSYSESDQLINLNIHLGIGWQFPLTNYSAFTIQPGITYLLHNNRLENFPSERVLPENLNTVNVTTIDWEISNTFGVSLHTGYQKSISDKWLLEINGGVTFSSIEGDIVNSPTSNDFDRKSDMSRDYFIYSVGLVLLRDL